MRSRLTFPSAGKETKYVWDRYNIQNNGIYKWDKHNIINETKYYWDKYGLLDDKRYHWYEYEASTTVSYTWNKYNITTVNSSTASSNYIQHIYYTENKSKYLKLSDSLSTSSLTDYYTTYANVYFFRADNTYVKLSQTEIQNNLFSCNPLLYGFVGMGDTYTNYPKYYFSPTTTMSINDRGWLYFDNIYSNYNYRAKGNGLVNTKPSSGSYITYTMNWPTTLKDALVISKTNASLGDLKYSTMVGDEFYEMLNDGYWKKDSDAVGAYIKNESTLQQIIVENQDAYTQGVVGSYFYTPGETIYETFKGDYIQEVTSLDESAYPKDGAQGNRWYVSFVPSIHYWNKYRTYVEKYIVDEYKYFATTKQAFICERYDLSPGGVTFKRPIQTRDEATGEYYVFDYLGISLGELTNAYWPMGGRDSTSLAYWLVLDNTYDDNSVYSGSTIKPISAIPYYTESLLDYNNVIGEEANILYGKSMLDYTTIVGVGFANSYNGSSGNTISYYLFTPETVWGRQTGDGGILFNNVYPLIFENAIGSPNTPISSSAGFGWEPGNTATADNKGCYVNYINTMKMKWSSFDDWRIDKTNYISEIEIREDNPLFYKLLGYFNYPSNHHSARLAYKDYQNGHYYLIKACHYNAEIGDYVGRRTSSSPIHTDNPTYLTSPTATTSYYVLVDKEYAQGYLLGQVSSRDINAYPADGMIEGDNDSYYVYSHFEEDDKYVKGEYIETVESTKSNTYPQDSHLENNWYVYKESKDFQYLGTYIESVEAETKLAYPINGIANNYWYVFTEYENKGPYKSRWVDEVETNQSNSYPADGIQGDYWYVYKKSYEGYKLQINDSELKGGINYKHNINPEQDFIIGCVSSAEIDFEYDNRRNDFDNYLAQDYCDYYTWQPNDTDWRLMGRFWITDAEYTKNTVKVKAFDSILASDTFVDEFIENTTFPITVEDFFNNLCEHLNIEGSVYSSVSNRFMTFADNFEAINITARQLFQYIAEVAGGFIVSGLDGKIELRTYESTGKSLNNSNYTTYSRQRYNITPISGLTVRMNADDLGVSSGDVESNPYIIENNPLFYTESIEEITPEINALYYALKNITYRPATVKLLQDFGINCGDIIHIDNDIFYVMNKELSASGCKLECFGNKERDKKPTSINSDIIALRGKTNELFRDLDTTRSTLTDRANGLQSQITQTAEEINLRVTNEIAGLESEISQTAEQISSRVTNEVAGLESKITQTADSITSTVTDEINQAKSEIKQTTDSISLEVQNQGDLVAQLVLDVDGISARGYVTFTDLAGSGTTIINGSNITTGTISADRINLKGAISWGDLDDDCQDTIASYAGADGSDADVPDYIHGTYIDAITIKSPTIQGGTISAGTKAEGYMKMSSSGMNFKSSTGGNLLGIGFYPGRYNFPYIIFGDGVDSVGTDRGMIKKYSWGMWIGDNDGQQNDEPTGTGLMIDFKNKRLLMYKDGVSTVL